jgi:hypothetical protein
MMLSLLGCRFQYVLFFLHGTDCLIVDRRWKLVFQRCFVVFLLFPKHDRMAQSC